MKIHHKTVICIALCLFTLSTICAAPSSSTKDKTKRIYLWDRASSIMSTADNKEDFLHAASAYLDLAHEGAANAPLFYNLGTALLLAEEYDEAAFWLLRAERYEGTTWDIERNLQLALSNGNPGTNTAATWYRVLLFWHFNLSTPLKGAIATIAFAFIWLALIIAVIRKNSPIHKPLLAISLIAFILFATSYLASLYAEFNQATTRIIEKYEK